MLLPAGGGARSTNTRLVAGPAEAPRPLKDRVGAPFDPVNVSRQHAVELKRARTSAEPPRSGRTREVVAEPPEILGRPMRSTAVRMRGSRAMVWSPGQAV